MKKILIFVAAMAWTVAGGAVAKPIASCGNEAGKAYYPFAGAIPANKSGWTDDAITNGKVTLDLAADGTFDLLYLDSTGVISSARKGGAEVIASAVSPTNVSVIVAFAGNTTEIYDFYKNSVGTLEYTHVVSKPASILVPKAGVYVGKCSFIDFGGHK